MPLIHSVSTLRLLRKSCLQLGLIFVFALPMWGCEGNQVHENGGLEQKKPEFTQDISRPVFEFKRESLAMKVSAGNLGFRGLGEGQRALFDKGPDLQVADNNGKTIFHLTANSAIALFPYAEISLKEFSLQTSDGTEFEGDELVWPYQSLADHVGMLGHTLLITKTVMLEGDTIIGQDLLLQGYKVLHVLSALGLSAIKGDSTDSNTGQ